MFYLIAAICDERKIFTLFLKVISVAESKNVKKKSFEKSFDYLIAEKALMLSNEYNSFENSAILSFLLLRVNFTLIKAGRKMQKTQFLKSTLKKYKKIDYLSKEPSLNFNLFQSYFNQKQKMKIAIQNHELNI